MTQLTMATGGSGAAVMAGVHAIWLEYFEPRCRSKNTTFTSGTTRNLSSKYYWIPWSCGSRSNWSRPRMPF
ncbi:hypothetical protein J6590_004949 [Homalodisca vitripennis]|nr:hypothetical protein J6590_004949 [Homalodisca vitripennis]